MSGLNKNLSEKDNLQPKITESMSGKIIYDERHPKKRTAREQIERHKF
jgi:hypothetical protein